MNSKQDILRIVDTFQNEARGDFPTELNNRINHLKQILHDLNNESFETSSLKVEPSDDYVEEHKQSDMLYELEQTYLEMEKYWRECEKENTELRSAIDQLKGAFDLEVEGPPV